MFSRVLSVTLLAFVVASQKIGTGTFNDGWIDKRPLKWKHTDHQRVLEMDKRLFQDNTKKLITAPRGFLKSTNLEMLKDHYETSNSTRRPVLFVNLFAHETVTTQQRVYEVLREKIHLMYLQHVYLTTSSKLDSREREICERWCSLRFTELTNHAVSIGMTHLTRCLCKHWSHTVTLLVDEYDSIIMNALHSANNAEFRLIVQLIYGQIAKLVKYNDFVGRVVITGESFIAGAELAAKNDLELYRFLGDHPMVHLFGLFDTQLDNLITNETERNEVRNWYGGYTNKRGVSVYNPFSVYKFLRNGVLKSYWRQNRHVHLARLLQISFIEESVKTMLRYECAPVSLVEWANLDVLVTLKSFLENIPESPHHEAVHDLFFTYLFDQGYFSFGKNNSSCIVIPNLEVDQALSQTLKQHLVVKHKLNQYRLEECAKSITSLYSNVQTGKECLTSIMGTFFKSLEDLFRDYRYYYGTDVTSEEDLTEIMYALANCAPGFVAKSKLKIEYLNENNISRKGSIDLYLYKESFAIIIELSHAKSQSPNSKGSLQRILDRQYYNVTNNSLYTPRKINHYLLVGLSVNNKALLSISSLLDSTNVTEVVTVRKLLRPPVKRPSNFTRKAKRRKTTEAPLEDDSKSTSNEDISSTTTYPD